MEITSSKRTKKFSLPPIGLRLIKTAVAVFICCMIHIIRGEEGFLFYSVSTSVFCMQQFKNNSKASGKNRIFGTVNGAFWGCLILLLNSYVIYESPMSVKYFIISLAIIFVIYTSFILKKPGDSYFSCVVFLSATVSHITDSNPYVFVFNRMLDTIIGIVVSLVVNSIEFPKKYHNDILFVSGLNETLLNEREEISAYSNVEINRMIEKGAKFTISTERTIPALIETVKVLKLNLPVIAYDGAILYDIHKKRYIEKKIISKETTEYIIEHLTNSNLCCFSSCILQEVSLIYYTEFHQEIEEKLYDKLRNSYYRNYVKGTPRLDCDCYYIMCISTHEKIREIYHQLKKSSVGQEIRMVRKLAEGMEGYTFLKIYDVSATKENMLNHLKSLIDIKKTITCGSIKGQYDILVDPREHYKGVVKQIKNIYEIFPWEKEYYRQK